MKQFVKDNGGVLTVIGVAVVLLGGYAEWRISANVGKVLEAENLASASSVATLKEDLKDDIDDLEGDIENLDGKIDQVIGILLEED